MNMKIAFFTLGCKVNQFETQAMEKFALLAGHSLCGFSSGEADAYIINSCTVTAVSDKKTRNAVRRAYAQNKTAVIALCGCYAEAQKDVKAQLPELTIIAGNKDHRGLIAAVEEAFLQKQETGARAEPCLLHADGLDFEQLPAGILDGHTRALLKIEDGCNNFCSYCIIPHVRGRVRSLPLLQIREEVAQIRESGVLELVVTGIEISSYGLDFGLTFLDALRIILAEAAGMRVRLGSLEPRVITAEFCKVAEQNSNLCRHFHLSLQSGCDATLRRMNRKYTTGEFSEAAARLRRAFPEATITTDLICGFPGETEAEFAETLAFIREIGFLHMHIFPYSEREGTPAASMKGSVPKPVRKQRALEAEVVAAEMKCGILAAQVGKTHSVLFEQRQRNGSFMGYTENYIPVEVLTGEELHSVLRFVEITGVSGDGLTGVLVQAEN